MTRVDDLLHMNSKKWTNVVYHRTVLFSCNKQLVLIYSGSYYYRSDANISCFFFQLSICLLYFMCLMQCLVLVTPLNAFMYLMPVFISLFTCSLQYMLMLFSFCFRFVDRDYLKLFQTKRIVYSSKTEWVVQTYSTFKINISKSWYKLNKWGKLMAW